MVTTEEWREKKSKGGTKKFNNRKVLMGWCMFIVFIILRNPREGTVARKWSCSHVPWRTYPTRAVLCLWPPVAHPPWDSFLFACSAVELPSPLRSARSPSCVLPPSRTWRRLFPYGVRETHSSPTRSLSRTEASDYPCYRAGQRRLTAPDFYHLTQAHWIRTPRHTPEHWTNSTNFTFFITT